MRHVFHGVIVGTFCVLSHLFSQIETQITCHEQVEYDHCGHPAKLIVDVYATRVPVVDGMVMMHEKQEYQGRYEYNISGQSVSGNSVRQSLELQKSISHDFNHYSAMHQQVHTSSNQSGFYCSVRAVPHEYGILESMSGEELLRNAMYNRYCKIMYHMDICQKANLLSCKASKFKEKLLSDKSLSNRAILELLRDYLRGCHNPNKQKYVDLKKDVEAEVRSREQQELKQIEQQVQQHVQFKKKELEKKLREESEQRKKAFIIQQHEQVNDELGWLEVSDELYEVRDQALDQSRVENYEQYQQRYELDVQTCGYLQSKKINYHSYEQCFGTALQQQYHQEVCDVFKELAEQELHYNRKAHLFDHACNFAQATYEANNKIWLTVAGALSWTAQQLVAVGKDVYDKPFGYAKAIVEGVYESAHDTLHMLLRPDQALYGLGQIIYFVLETSAIAEAAASYPCQETFEVYQQRREQIDTMLTALKEELASLDGPGRLKAVTKFCSDLYIPGKITHACCYMLSGLCARARGVRTLEGAAAMMVDEFGLAEILEDLALRQNSLNLQWSKALYNK